MDAIGDNPLDPTRPDPTRPGAVRQPGPADARGVRRPQK